MFNEFNIDIESGRLLITFRILMSFSVFLKAAIIVVFLITIWALVFTSCFLKMYWIKRMERKGTVSRWVWICCFKLEVVTKSFEQIWHSWGFSPLCILSCLFKLDAWNYFINGLMLLKYLSESLITRLTSVWFFSTMSSFMFLEGWVLSECFLAGRIIA